MQASEEFSNKLRQATGIAKAPFVAEFARMLVEAGETVVLRGRHRAGYDGWAGRRGLARGRAGRGETVVLCGWPRAVYDVWQAKLAGLRLAKYTGSETGSEKDEI